MNRIAFLGFVALPMAAMLCAIRPQSSSTTADFATGYVVGLAAQPQAYQAYVRRYNGTTRSGNVVNYLTAGDSKGTDITYLANSGAGDSFLINVGGIYSVSVNAVDGSGTGSALEIRLGTLDNANNDAKTRSRVSGQANGAVGANWTGAAAAGELVFVNFSSTIGAFPFLNSIDVGKVVNP